MKAKGKSLFSYCCLQAVFLLIFFIFYSVCNNHIQFRCLYVTFTSIKLLIYNFILVIFRSFGSVTPSYNIALMGNSDSLYELSPGT
jgi:hypothetical protein